MRRRMFTAAVMGVSAAVVTVSAVTAATTSVVDEDGDAGWAFNADASTSTRYHFSLAEHSTGTGSLFVPPITNATADGLTPEPSDKLIAAQLLDAPAESVTSIAYDFLVASAGQNDHDHFYLNVYVELPGGVEHFYDCRFDFVPPAFDPVAPSGFSTFTVTGSTSPTHVEVRNDGTTLGCPATLGGLPAGANIDLFALNVGDTSANDAGVSGYYDNVVVTNSDGTSTAFDFEVLLAVKDACKDGGWANFGVFSNQGDCVSYLQADDNASK